MRAMRVRWLAALLVAATSACGESVGPEASARDLEFVVPVGVGVEEHSQDPISGATMVPLEVGASSVDGSELAFFPIVDDYWLRLWFSGSVLVLEYGLYGVGTGYSISPTVIATTADGRSLPTDRPQGLSEDAGIAVHIDAYGREQFNVGVSCGALASANATFEIRVSLPGLSKYAFWRTMRQSDAQARQAACAAPPTSSGGNGGAPGGDELLLCWYDVWYNSAGKIILVQETSCTSLGPIEM